MNKFPLLVGIGVCLILLGVVFPIGTYVTTYFLPREYTSTVTLRVRPSEQVINVLERSQGDQPVDPHFVADQIQTIKSKPALLRVIDELSLVDKWSAGQPAKLTREQAYGALLKMIDAKEVRDTDVATIAVTSADGQEAADIANTIAATYMRIRQEEFQRQIESALVELRSGVEKQRQNVEAMKAEIEAIRARENVVDSNPDGVETPLIQNPGYQAAKKKYLDAKRALEAGEQSVETERMNIQAQNTPVLILDRAEKARLPSSPNVSLIMMVACGIGLLCFVCGLVPLIAGIRLRDRLTPPHARA
jgi:uncharacterized protein involved in exopolysaccharide biosynthesis